MDGSDTIRFLDFRLDKARGELFRGDEIVPVEPQVLDLIAELAERPGEILSRDQLIEAVWNGRIVSESAFTSRINSARAALGDDGMAQRIIKTVPKRGYRFEASVETGEQGPSPDLPDKPSIAVLPFQNMSGDPEQTYFSDGITDDIITDLSRYGELFVIARHSSFQYRDSADSPSYIAQNLGVQYLAEGSVRRAGNRVRITARLIDPWAGNEVWAERYDRDLTDMFEVQDEITAVIVNTLAGQIAKQHYLRVSDNSLESIAAYDHVLRATEHALRIAPEDNRLARDEATKALAIDAKITRAHAIIALTHINESNNFWVEDPSKALDLAHSAASKAVADDPRDPWAYAMLSIADLWRSRAHERANSEMRRALGLNPSNSYIRSLNSYLLAFNGRAGEALDEIDRAIHTNPHFPPVFHGFRGRALLLLRRVDEALPNLQQMVTEMPGHSNALGYCAVAYAAHDRLDVARALVSELCVTNQFYRLRALRNLLPFANPSDLEFVIENLERAGLPE